MKVLVTGASGFIGRALCGHLSREGFKVVPVVRSSSNITGSVRLDADDDVGWRCALQGCDAVVHLAGKSKVDVNDSKLMDALRDSNVTPTISLYHRAALAGVRRFIFISTVKVNGEHTAPGSAFSVDDTPAPRDAYALSKWEAETGLRALVSASSPELVIIRPPMVYGPGVKGNFAFLVRLVRFGIPLPLSCVQNERSILAVENLCSFIEFCIELDSSLSSVSDVFFVADTTPLSTPQLLREIALAYGVTPRLFCFPAWLMRLACRAVGNTSLVDRVLESLVIDTRKSSELAGWRPTISVAEQLRRMRLAENS